MIQDTHNRYDLLCRASQATADENQLSFAVVEQLTALKKHITHDLPALARQGSPDHFADLLRNLEQELTRFAEFCEFPDLAQKVVVGIGGKFSAGKSSYINAILGKKRLVSEVDPTTSLPTYLLHGVEDRITALNLFGRRVLLTQDDFLSLTHEEKAKYGSQVGTLLRSAFMSDPDFAWKNIALLDTPGYTKPENQAHNERTDEQVARTQLNAAQFVLWLVPAEDGGIKEDDVQFLASLRQDIPRLVLVNKADKKTPDDVAAIVALVKKTLAERNLAVLDVLPVSRQTRHFPTTAVTEWLDRWNSQTVELTFVDNFKAVFDQYAAFVQQQQQQTRDQLHRLNQIMVLADEHAVVNHAKVLREAAVAADGQWQALASELAALRVLFFKEFWLILRHFDLSAEMEKASAAGVASVLAEPEPEPINELDQGVWTDPKTGMMWMRHSLGQAWDGTAVRGEANRYTWDEAHKAVADLNKNGGFAGYTDWQLPDIGALKTIMIYGKEGYNCPDGVLFQPANDCWGWYWSSSPNGNSNAWLVNFDNGISNSGNKYHYVHVRVVRGS